MYASTTDNSDITAMDPFLLPFFVFAFFIAFFHCIVKPAITSIIIVNIFLFTKNKTTTQYIKDELLEEEDEASLLPYAGFGFVITCGLIGMLLLSNSGSKNKNDTLVKNNNNTLISKNRMLAIEIVLIKFTKLIEI